MKTPTLSRQSERRCASMSNLLAVLLKKLLHRERCRWRTIPYQTCSNRDAEHSKDAEHHGKPDQGTPPNLPCLLCFKRCHPALEKRLQQPANLRVTVEGPNEKNKAQRTGEGHHSYEQWAIDTKRQFKHGVCRAMFFASGFQANYHMPSRIATSRQVP